MKLLTEASARLIAPAYLPDLLNKNVYSIDTRTKINIEKTRWHDYQVKLFTPL